MANKITPENEGLVNSFGMELTAAMMGKSSRDAKITKEDAALIIDNAVTLATAWLAAGATPGTNEPQ